MDLSVRKLVWPVEGPGSILSTIKTKTKHHSSSTWQHRPIIPARRRLQQKDHSSRLAGLVVFSCLLDLAGLFSSYGEVSAQP